MPANVNPYLTTCPAPGIFGAAPAPPSVHQDTNPTRLEEPAWTAPLSSSAPPASPATTPRKRCWRPDGEWSACPGRRATRSPASSTCTPTSSTRRRWNGAVAGKAITHLFFTTWSRQDTEADNCRVNGAMLANTLDALRRTSELEHAVLVTGLKHYLGPFEAYASAPADTPFRESQDRLPFQNFYYDEEDILFAAAARTRILLVGAPAAHDDRLRAGQRHEHGRDPRRVRHHLPDHRRAVRLPGQPAAVRRRHRHHGCPAARPPRGVVGHRTPPLAIRRSTPSTATCSGGGRCGNALPRGSASRRPNTPGSRTRSTAGWATPTTSGPASLREHGLQPYKASELASWWHTDADLGRQVETFADMSKSRALGFLDFQDSARSFLDLFDTLRAQKIIPPLS